MRQVLIALSLSVILAVSPAIAGSAYEEVPRDHWAYGAMDYCCKTGLLEGFPSGFFSGEKLLTRYEFAQGVARSLDSWDSEAEYPTHLAWMLDDLGREFGDQSPYPGCFSSWTIPLPHKPANGYLPNEVVPAGHWSYAALDFFNREGILRGYREEYFSRENILTRREMSLAVARVCDSIELPYTQSYYRLAEALRGEFSEEIRDTSNINYLDTGDTVQDQSRAIGEEVEETIPSRKSTVYSDVPVGHWSYYALDELTRDWEMQGYPAGRFNGQMVLTRYDLGMAVVHLLRDLDKDCDLTVRCLVGALADEYADVVDETQISYTGEYYDWRNSWRLPEWQTTASI